ncbi:YolD-like family protein [Paenibacillus lutimineralis]|nr:YolD-like family protein [Paenibacillus lutimineralis]
MKRQSREATRKTRPVLDVQELEQIQLVLSESFHEHWSWVKMADILSAK